MFGIVKLADETIIDRIKEGDEKILVHLYKQYHTMVKNFVLKNNGNDDMVEDIMQDSVIAVWKNVNKPGFSLQSKLSTYLMAIAKNLHFKELKKRSKFKVVDESDHRMEQSENMQMDMDKSIISELTEQMDDTCRKLLSYFYFDGFSTKVIAEKLDFANANSVKSKKYQCFKKLQATVVKQYKKEDLI